MSAASVDKIDAPHLPAGFDSLQPFVGWCLRTETERIHKRQSSVFTDILAFKDAAVSELGRVFAHLDGKPLDALCAEDQNLLLLALSLAEISPAVEFYRQPKVIEGFDALRFMPVEDCRLRPSI